MDARILDLPFDPKAVTGLSKKLLRSHHQNNYGGAVKRLNALSNQLKGRDYGAAAGACVGAFMQNIGWTQVYGRYQRAVTQTSEGLGATADETTPARPIDVRRAGIFEPSDAMAEGAGWRDPAKVDAWATELQAGEPVVVYCVHGHEVGRSTAMRPKAAGVDARFLIGALDGWRSQGRPVVGKRGG